MNDQGFSSIGEFINLPKTKKPPAHDWQDLALEVIAQIKPPKEKRNSIFRICKQYPRAQVLQSLNDTKELCKTGEKWKYFFKIINGK